MALFLLFPAAVRADPPKFSSGGFVLSLQYGPGLWNLDRNKFDQVPLGATFVAQQQSTHTLGLTANYTIMGHASLGVEFTGTGSNAFNANRAGAGWLVGTLSWHPLELVYLLLKKETRPLPFDFRTFFGAGYGIAGGGAVALGMDGLALEWGMAVDYFFTRSFGVGLFARGVFLQWNKLYTDYNNNVFLPMPAGTPGSFWHLGLQLDFRAGD